MSTKVRYIFMLTLCLTLTSCVARPSIQPTIQPTALEANRISKAELLIAYSRNEEGDGVDEISSCIRAYPPYYRFVLYGDGHLIRFDETQYLEARISQLQIDELLTKIDATGFSSLAGDGDQYIQNSPPPSFIDTWEGSITINEKTITIAAGQTDYLVDAVMKTLGIIESYKPKNLQPYAPETLALWVYLEESILLGLASPTPEPSVLKWSVEEIDLDNLLVDNIDPAIFEPKVISGASLSFLLQQVEHIPALRTVEQNGQTYLVAVCPNFP